MDFRTVVEKYVNKDNEKIALCDSKVTITYAELYKKIINNQDRLEDRGIKEGTKVILQTSDMLKYIVVFLSLLAKGCWVIPVASNMSRWELQEIMQITDGIMLENMEVYFVKENDNNENSSLTIDITKTGIYHITSGTTDKPKICIRTFAALLAESESYIRTFNITEKDKLMSAAPLYHSFALGAIIFPALMSGASIYTINQFIPRKIVRMIEDYKITMLTMVPIMAKALCEMYSKKEYSLKSLRIPLVGAGVITRALDDSFFGRYGIHLMSNYGSTETGGLISRVESEPLESMGKPMYGVKIKVCDEQKNIVENGQEGELYIKAEGMFSGYFSIEEQSIDSDGYHPMGDIVSVNEEGYIFYKGRKKLMINIGGKKINPLEVEKILLELPNIEECAIIEGKLGNREVIKAIIVSNIRDSESIRKYCLSKLSEYKVPNIIEYVQEIPKNNMGKIDRYKLHHM